MASKRERTEYGERLFQARTKAKLTQPQLAKAAGMAQSTLAELEYIGSGSSFTAQIANACGVRAEWLANGEGPMVDQPLELRPEVAAVAKQINDLTDKQRAWVLSTLVHVLEVAHETFTVNTSALDQSDEEPSRPTTPLQKSA
jgi:transcriptional regulator with XRE-family HTH domain